MKAILIMCVCLMLYSTEAWHDDSFAHPFECRQCLSTEYCTNGEVYACPLNSAISIQVPNRNGTITQCICDPGYEVDHSQSSVHTCQDGTPPHYYQGGIKKTCPQHKETTENLASLISQCKCVPGYEKRTGTAFCDACVVNEYSDEYDIVQCKTCPTNSQSPGTTDAVASDNIDHCKCNTGYEGNLVLADDSCSACAAGKYKDTVGTVSCENCAVNQFSLSGAETCTDCHADSSAPAASVERAACACNQGFEPAGAANCAMCEIGHAKNIAENAACSPCTGNEIAAEAGMFLCTTCNDFMMTEPSDKRDACVCLSGRKPALVEHAGKGLDVQLVNSAPFSPNFHTVQFYYPDVTQSWLRTVNRYIMDTDYYAAQADLEGYRTIRESFKILQFSNFGFNNPSGSDQSFSVTITLKKAFTVLDTVTLTFALKAGANALELSDVSSTADDEVPRRNIVLPQVFALDKAKLANSYFNSATNELIAGQHFESVNGLSQEDAARLGNDFIESGYTDYNNDYYGVTDKRTKLLVSLHAYTVTSAGYEVVCPGEYYALSRDTVTSILFGGTFNDAYTMTFHTLDTEDDLAACKSLCDTETYDNPDGNTYQCIGIQFTTKDVARHCALVFGPEFNDELQEGLCYNSDEKYSILKKNAALACADCPVDHYLNEAVPPQSRGAELCLQCPPDSTTDGATAQDDILDCLCEKGFKQELQSGLAHRCVECAAGTYKDTISNGNSCTACPSNSVTDHAASEAKTDCKCNAGFEGTAHQDTCTACPAGKTKASIEDGSCFSCTEGRYKASEGPGNCDFCHDHSTSDVESTSIESCFCNAGFQREDDSDSQYKCTQCVAGKARPAGDDHNECSQCGADAISAAGAATCTTCLANSVPNEDNTQCLCNAGYYLQGGLCLECAPGTYKDGINNNACDACLQNSETEVSDAPYDVKTKCKCSRGYFQDTTTPDGVFDFTCVACADGHYSASLNSPSCTECDAEHRTPRANFPWTSSDECEECDHCGDGEYKTGGCDQDSDSVCADCTVDVDAFSSTPAGTAGAPNSGQGSCVCIAGYGFDGSDCVPCNTGEYKESLADAACTACGGLGGLGTTLELADGDLNDVEVCMCGPGQTLNVDSGVCVECAAGTAKNVISDQACDDCTVNPGYNTDSAGALVCVCGIGFGNNPGRANPGDIECQECDPGTFSDTVSAGTCENCGAEEYQMNSGQSDCISCPPESTSAAGSRVCTCNAGYQIDEDAETFTHICDPCSGGDLGTFKPVDAVNDVCQNCENGCQAGKRVLDACTTTTDLVCQDCQDNSNSPANLHLDFCYCNAGYEFVDNECSACPVGKAKSSNSDNTVMCQDCELGSTFASGEASANCAGCNPICGTDQRILEECTQTSQTVCVGCLTCEPGHYRVGDCFADRTDDYRCETCPDGSYCPGGKESAVSCGGGKKSREPRTEVANCGCADGEYFNGDTKQCTECPTGSWCIDDTQYPCPLNSDSAAGSSAMSQCECRVGYYKVSDDSIAAEDPPEHTCEICPANSYCPNVNTAAPVDCPDLSDPYQMTSTAGSDDVYDCVCAAGSFNDIDGSVTANDHDEHVCTQCPAGSYCTGVEVQGSGSVQIACTTHRSNTWTQGFAGSTSSAACVCSKGYYLDDTVDPNVCNPCEPDYYCVGQGTGRDDCPKNDDGSAFVSTSPAQSDDLADCKCDDGYERQETFDPPDSSNLIELGCRECISGEYCFGGQMYECTDENARSDPGSNLATDCICRNGYQQTSFDAETGPTCLECVQGEYCSNGAISLCSNVASIPPGILTTEQAQSHDATQCVCPPGYYFVENDDADNVVCGACGAEGVGVTNTYCPGYHTAADAKPQCPPNSQSPELADALSLCACDETYYKSLTDAENNPNDFVCVLCPDGSYCPAGSLAPIACPGSNVHSNIPRLGIDDCECDAGYHNNNVDFVEGGTAQCEVCPVDNYCTGTDNSIVSCETVDVNSHTNEADAQYLESHCICKAGFGIFSVGAQCTECQSNFYCLGDGTTGSDLSSPIPSPCCASGAASCDGDNRVCSQVHSCDNSLPHTRTSEVRATSFAECLCEPGHQDDGIPECTPCEQTDVDINGGTFKVGTSNVDQCQQCDPCNGVGEYYAAVCTTTSDTDCQPCQPCENTCDAEASDYPRCEESSYWSQVCANAEPGVCTKCNRCTADPNPDDGEVLQYYLHTCTIDSPADCEDVNQDVVNTHCDDGYYLGGHTPTQDSSCQLCSLGDIDNPHLHVFTGKGTFYNDATSCPFECVQNAKLIDTSNPKLGCESCASGNFLFRQPNQGTNADGQYIDCAFTCRHNTVENAAGTDCELAHMELDQNSLFEHTLTLDSYNVDAEGFDITVTHTTHSRYILFVGKDRVGVQNECRPGSTIKTCCGVVSAARVTSNGVAGFKEDSETCQMSDDITIVDTASPTKTEFIIQHVNLEDLATCTTTGLQTACLLFVTMFDVLRMRGISIPIKITEKVSAYTGEDVDGSVAFLSPQINLNYLPLDVYTARVMLLGEQASKFFYEIEFRLSVDTTQVPAADSLHAQFLDASPLQRVGAEADLPTCARYTPTTDANSFFGTLPISDANTHIWTTFWESSTQISTLSLAMELVRHRAGGSSELLAHVGIFRDLHKLQPLCVDAPVDVKYDTAEIYAVNGYGKDTAARIVRQVYTNRPFETFETSTFSENVYARAEANALNTGNVPRGRASRLMSFIVMPHAVTGASINIRSVLSAHFTESALTDEAKKTEIEDKLKTAFAGDTSEYSKRMPLDFTPSFRSWCRAETECLYEYHRLKQSNFIVITVNSGVCTTSQKQSGVSFLKSQLGVVGDIYGHVEALCSYAETFTHNDFAVVMVTLKSSTNARNFEERVRGVGTKSFVWLDALVTT